MQVRKFDSVFKEYLENHSISLLKVDTEGYEAEVVNGAAGDFLEGLVTKSAILKSAPLHFSKNAKASFLFENLLFNSALTTDFLSTKKSAIKR